MMTDDDDDDDDDDGDGDGDDDNIDFCTTLPRRQHGWRGCVIDRWMGGSVIH